MDNVLKYDPIKTFQEQRDFADAMDTLISYRIESNLEEKVKLLLSQLIASNDDALTSQYTSEIQNLQKDIDDLRVARDVRIRKMRERKIW